MKYKYPVNAGLSGSTDFWAKLPKDSPGPDCAPRASKLMFPPPCPNTLPALLSCDGLPKPNI